MSTSDQPAGTAGQEQAPVWGAPTPPERRPVWSTRNVVIAVVVAVVLAGGGGAAIAAAATGSASGSSGGSAGPGGFGGRMGGFGGMGGAAGLGGGLADVLHGDVIASDGSGGTRTERLQTGKVTSVGSTSLTVASTDGYAGTYVIGSSTRVDGGQDQISAVRSGDTVTVTATVSGSTATATSVLDQARMRTRMQQDGGQGGPPQGGPGGN